MMPVITLSLGWRLFTAARNAFNASAWAPRFIFFGCHLGFAKSQFGRAAIAVRQGHHTWNVVQGHGDVHGCPKKCCAMLKFGMNGTNWATGKHKLAVVVAQLVAGDAVQQAHVLPAQGGKAWVNAIDQHGLVLATGRLAAPRCHGQHAARQRGCAQS
jgi:hypothetical protein